MTKTDYLNQLHRYLRKLPKEDYQEAMDFFTEYFEEAGPENETQVIEELGSPKEAAHEVITRLLNEKIIEDKPTLKNRTTMTWIALLAILASPLAIPLLLTLLAIIFTVLVFLFTVVVLIYSFVLIFLISGISLLVTSFPVLVSSPSAALLGMGAGLMTFGLALLLFLFSVAFCKGIFKLIILLINWIIKKGRKS